MKLKILSDIAWSASCLVRTGWMQRGVPPSLGESVADHSFSAALIAYEIALELKDNGVDIDPERAALIALYHDLHEVIVGDIPKWSADRANDVKESLEKEAIGEMKRWLRGVKLAEEYFEDTKEAIVARIAEKLSTYFQALRYENMGIERVEEIADSTLKGVLKEAERLKEIDEEAWRIVRKMLSMEGI